MRHIGFLIISTILMLSCANSGSTNTTTQGDSIYIPEYASGFEIVGTEGDSSSIIRIRNPWQGAQDVQIEVFLSRNAEKAPEGFKGVTLTAPLKRVVCMSSSYVAFIAAIGCLDAVKGVSGARFITNQQLRDSYQEDRVKDVGYDTNLNYELIASLRPDVVMIYGVAGENSTLSGKLNELGINVMYIGDYIEQSPLGKAEWIVAIGEMFDRREQAQSIFETVKQEYNTLKTKVEGVTKHPLVMLNAPWRDTWFVPGDRSYMVRLIDDAGGDYTCRGEDSDISRPISGESAFILASRSDVWLNPNQASTLEEVVQLNPNFRTIPPVVNKQVYNNTKRNTEDGGSDFWESGAVYPNIVLRDMIQILHPELQSTDEELYYFKKLE